MAASRTPSAPLSVADVQSIVGEIVEQRRRDSASLRAQQTLAERSPTVRRLMLIALTTLTAWIWFAPPAWLMPEPAPLPSPQFVEASERVALYVAGQQVEQYRRTHGRLPRTFAEMGRAFPGIAYAPSDTSFELTKQMGGILLRYRSVAPTDSQLTESLRRVGALPR